MLITCTDWQITERFSALSCAHCITVYILYHEGNDHHTTVTGTSLFHATRTAQAQRRGGNGGKETSERAGRRRVGGERKGGKGMGKTGGAYTKNLVETLTDLATGLGNILLVLKLAVAMHKCYQSLPFAWLDL